MLPSLEPRYVACLLDRWQRRRACVQVSPCEPGVSLVLVDGCGIPYHRSDRLYPSLDRAQEAGRRLLSLLPN